MKTLRIDISTLRGLLQAELLQKKGWVIVSVGFNTIDMKKENKK